MDQWGGVAIGSCHPVSPGCRPPPPFRRCANVGQLHCDPAPSRLFEHAKEELLTRVLERVSVRGGAFIRPASLVMADAPNRADNGRDVQQTENGRGLMGGATWE